MSGSSAIEPHASSNAAPVASADGADGVESDDVDEADADDAARSRRRRDAADDGVDAATRWLREDVRREACARGADADALAALADIARGKVRVVVLAETN